MSGFALLRRELRVRRGAVARILAWSVVETLPALLSGLVVAAAIDRFLAGRVGAGITLLAALLPAAAVGAVATTRLFPWLATVVEPVRDAFLTAVVEGAMASALRRGGAPDAAGVARLTEQVQTVRNILFGLLRTARQTAFTFLAALVGLAMLAPLAALACGVLVAVALALFAALLPGLAARHTALLLAGEEITRRAGNTLAGMRDVIACGAQDRAVAELGTAVDREATLARALSRATVLRNVVVFVGAQLPLVLLLAAAPWLLSTGRLSFGEVVGAATYLTVSLEPALRSIVGVVGSWGLDLATTLARLGGGFAPGDPTGVAPTTPLGDRADLAVEGLTFAYGPHADPVVRDLSFTVPAGDHLAVVGPSGIGKSTLANLLAGLLAPQAGVVRLGGVDVGRIREADLRRALALIPQEAYVFAGTVRENLAYLAPDADDAALGAAAEAVGLGPLVDRLGGLDAGVGPGGAALSQGEKQLVALARVHASPARIVILDEATANLDPVAEARAEAAFARRGGTLIVIAHRISSARRAGRILLLDGDRAHLGTHDELLRVAPAYAELVGRWERPAEAAVGAGPAR
jgi:ATP-binding cassette subfamily C protein